MSRSTSYSNLVRISTPYFAPLLGALVVLNACGGSIDDSPGPLADAGDAANGWEATVDAETCDTPPCPIVLASEQRNPFVEGLVLDATNVYWITLGASFEDGTVMKVAKHGGEPVTLAADQDHPNGIAVAGTSVYWTTSSAVMKVDSEGGEPMTIVSGREHPGRIAVNSKAIVWTESSGGQVLKVGLDGGSHVVLASSIDGPTALAVDGENAYWIGGGSLMSVGLAGGTPSVLASELVDAGLGLAVDATSVYWTDANDRGGEGDAHGSVMKVGLGGGAPVMLAAGQQTDPKYLALHDGAVYWTDHAGNQIATVGIGGGSRTTVARVDNMVAIAADESGVYCLAWGGWNGRVLVFPK